VFERVHERVDLGLALDVLAYCLVHTPAMTPPAKHRRIPDSRAGDVEEPAPSPT
jgi:hypothetical protein